MKKKILILASNPRNDLKLNREITDLKNVIKRSQNQSQFEIEFELEVHLEDLHEKFLDYEPRIVHFCGHGTGEQGLVLQNKAGREQKISTDALSNLFELCDRQVEGVLLNACYSEVQANAIVRHINYAIGMSHEIRDDAAIAFSKSFYRALSSGKSIEEAYKWGCNGIQLEIERSNASRSRSYEDNRNCAFVKDAKSAIVSEHLKPVLKKKLPLTVFAEEVKLANSNRDANLSTQSDLTAHDQEILKKAVEEEAKYKKYRDRARETWDDFGQVSIVRQPLTQNEYRQRQTLLNKIKDFWIEGFLKPSLYASAAINLDWKSNPNAVIRPFEGIEEDIPVELDESFEELQPTDILSQIGQGKTLLILGEPGSGKTITLLQLAQKLVNQTERDLTKPIPVVFNLSSWGQKQQSIEKWLIEEFKDKYQVPQTWSEPWLKQEQLILLLDGLDEVRAEQRNACVRALNQFITTHNLTEMVVCSRVKDYEALTERLRLSSAICIKPLSSKQVYSFLDKAGDSLAGLKTVLRQDLELEQFAQTPLILNIMSLAYQGWSREDLLQQFSSSEDRYRHLFDSYIERMLRRKVMGQLEPNKNSSQYSQDKVLHWLSWLAKTMVDESKIIFLIEKMQPTLLESRREKIAYRISNFLLGGLSVGPSVGLIFGLSVGLIVVLIFWLNGELSEVLNGELNGELSEALIFWLICGLIGWPFSGLIVVLAKEITLFEQMSWSWQRAKSRIIHEVIRGLIYGLISGLSGGPIFGLIFGLIYGLSEGPIFELIFELIYGLIYGLILGLIVGLIFGLIFGLILVLNGGLSSIEVKHRTFPNQGIWNSGKNSVRMGLIFGLIYGLILWLLYGLILGLNGEVGVGLIYGLIYGLILGSIFAPIFAPIFALLNGGTTCIQHFNLRRILYSKGRIPWNYARFLDYASERLLMKKVGGGYVFYHRMLMEHFAQRNRVSREFVPVTPRQTSQATAQANTRTEVRSRNIQNILPQPSNSVSNLIVCSNCSHKNSTNGKFCTKCGTKLA